MILPHRLQVLLSVSLSRVSGGDPSVFFDDGDGTESFPRERG